MSTKVTVAGTTGAPSYSAASREALVGDGDDADVGIDRGEGVVGRQHLVVGQRIEERRLADVGQADDADGEAHGAG